MAAARSAAIRVQLGRLRLGGADVGQASHCNTSRSEASGRRRTAALCAVFRESNTRSRIVKTFPDRTQT